MTRDPLGDRPAEDREQDEQDDDDCCDEGGLVLLETRPEQLPRGANLRGGRDCVDDEVCGAQAPLSELVVGTERV